MKLRNKILAMAVVAVAGVNVYLANDTKTQKNSLSLLNLENIAEAKDVYKIINGQEYYYGLADYWVYDQYKDGLYYYRCVEHANVGKSECQKGDYQGFPNPL